MISNGTCVVVVTASTETAGMFALPNDRNVTSPVALRSAGEQPCWPNLADLSNPNKKEGARGDDHVLQVAMLSTMKVRMEQHSVGHASVQM